MALVDVFPVGHGVEYFMCSVILKEGEGCCMFAVEDDEGVFEVEMREVGYESDLFFIFLAKLLQSGEFMALYFGGPDGVNRKEDDILAPLLQDFLLHFPERFEL